MFVPDLRNAKAVIVVFAMHGCPPCEEYLPMLRERLEAHNASNRRWNASGPFHIWSPGEPIYPGTIPVLFYDAASTDDDLQNLADRLKISATPTTCLLTRTGTSKVEGSMSPDKIDQLLLSAQNANR
jgi:hypothetical protein